MTVEVAPRRARKPKIASGTESLAIGEIDQTVFACPACARPLALGARRCPGCGVRLVLGVQAQRASIFAGVGLVAGLVIAVLFSATVSALDTARRDAEAAAAAALATPSAGPSAAATASQSPSPSATVGTGSSSNLPAITRAALTQVAAVDERLAASSSALTAALDDPAFDTFAVSQVLRATSADSVLGLQLTPHIASWSGGTAVAGELRTFYLSIQETAAEGLSASIRNEAAYRAAAEKMVALLGGLDEIDASVRDVAGRAGVTIP